METRKITSYTALLLGSTFLFASCVKDELYNTPHPTQGAVVITADWSGRSSESVLPDSYTLQIPGFSAQEVTAPTNVYHSLLNPDTYELLAFNSPSGMSFNGNAASVNLLPDNTLESHPGYLFSAVQSLDVQRDDTLHTTLRMQQRIRQLTLILRLTSGDHDRILSTESTLTGIAPSIELKNGSLPATGGAVIAPVFEKDFDSEGLPVLTATLRLLGITADDSQQLAVIVTLNNKNTQTILTDLTSLLHQSMTGSMAPLTLDATFNLPPEAGVSGSITDWATVIEDDINVN